MNAVGLQAGPSSTQNMLLYFRILDWVDSEAPTPEQIQELVRER